MIKKDNHGAFTVKKRVEDAIWGVDFSFAKHDDLDIIERHNIEIREIYEAHKKYVAIVEEAGELVEKENVDLRKRNKALEKKVAALDEKIRANRV